MKICIFSDIHGNLDALEKLVKTKDFLTADIRICLGDIVGIGAFQKECLDLLSHYNYIYIYGNHEGRLTGEIDDLKDIVGKQHFVYFRNELKDYLPKIKSLSKTYTLTMCGKKILFTHYGWKNGNIATYDKVLSTKPLLEQFSIDDNQYDYVFYGHIHKPDLQIEGHTTFFDIGSLGLKWPGNYTVITDNNNKINIKRKHIKFDKQKFVDDCKNKSYPMNEILDRIYFDNRCEYAQK